jgi:hypothetical protein
MRLRDWRPAARAGGLAAALAPESSGVGEFVERYIGELLLRDASAKYAVTVKARGVDSMAAHGRTVRAYVQTVSL